MRCSACKMDTEHARTLRKSWGCESESPNEIDRLPCYCDGSPHCSRCGGLGVVSLRRCPNSIVTNKEREMIRYSVLAKAGIWPVVGGSLDQAKSFLDSHAIIVSEIASIEEERMKDRGSASDR